MMLNCVILYVLCVHLGQTEPTEMDQITSTYILEGEPLAMEMGPVFLCKKDE